MTVVQLLQGVQHSHTEVAAGVTVYHAMKNNVHHIMHTVHMHINSATEWRMSAVPK